LAAGADATIPLRSGESIVMTAAQAGNAAVVRQLLQAGADPNVDVTRGQTALMWAANRGHSSVVKALLDHGADFSARSETREQYVKSEKEQDSNPAYKYWIEEGGNTPLIFAARSGDLESARFIVEAGADVNALSAFGTSALIMAVHGGNAELVNYLLQQGADVDSAASGHTALHDAVLRGDLAAVDVLLNHGANVEAILQKPTPVRRQSTDYNFHDALVGATPLWLAARFSEPDIMQALLDHGANPHATNNVSYPAQRMGENFMAEEGEISVLMAATGMGHRRLRMSWGTPERRAGQLGLSNEDLIYQSVETAIMAGVDLNRRDAEGQTALDFAKARRLDSVILLLLAAGAEE
ncbi:MAG: ankyrin repeat domain-containing protein, partial [Gammaproteobacteria bacterium]